MRCTHSNRSICWLVYLLTSPFFLFGQEDKAASVGGGNTSALKAPESRAAQLDSLISWSGGGKWDRIDQVFTQPCGKTDESRMPDGICTFTAGLRLYQRELFFEAYLTLLDVHQHFQKPDLFRFRVKALLMGIESFQLAMPGHPFEIEVLYQELADLLAKAELTYDQFDELTDALLGLEVEHIMRLAKNDSLTDQDFESAESRLMKLVSTVVNNPSDQPKTSLPYILKHKMHDHLGTVAYKVNYWVRAFRDFQMAHRISTEQKDTFRSASALEMLARLNGESGDEELRRKQLREAASYYEGYVDPYYPLDLKLEATGDPKEADRLFEQAYLAALTSKDTSALIRVLYTYAIKNDELERPAKRLDALMQIEVLSTKDQSNNSDITGTYADLSETYWEVGKFEQAKKYALKAKQMAATDPHRMYQAASVLARYYEAIGETDSALIFLNLAIDRKNYMEEHSDEADLIKTFLQSQFQQEKDLLMAERLQQQQLFLFLLLGLLLTSILAFTYYRNFRLKKQATSQLEQVNRTLNSEQVKLARINERLNRFSRGVSHDIHGGLGSIEALAELYEPEKNKHHLMVEFFEQTQLAIRQMRDYCSNLLASARASQEELALQVSDGDRILRDVLAQHRLTIRDLEAKVTTDQLKTLPLDPADLTQILQNLISNALTYISNNPYPQLAIQRRETPETIEIGVLDNGPGIPESEQEAIFSPSYSKRKGGHGLGLAMVRAIAREYNGDAWASSNSWEGATLWISLPKRSVDADQAPAKALPAEVK